MEEKYTIEELIDFMYNVMDWQDAEDEPAIYAIIDILKLHKKTEKEITGDLLNEYVNAKHKINNIEERLFNKAIEVMKWESENLGKTSRYINGKWICDSVSIENAMVNFTVHINTVNEEYETYDFSIELHKLLCDIWRENIKRGEQ